MFSLHSLFVLVNSTWFKFKSIFSFYMLNRKVNSGSHRLPSQFICIYLHSLKEAEAEHDALNPTPLIFCRCSDRLLKGKKQKWTVLNKDGHAKNLFFSDWLGNQYTSNLNTSCLLHTRAAAEWLVALHVVTLCSHP